VILLAKVGLLDVLQHLGAPVVIPKPAALEIQRGSPSDPAVQALANANWLVTVDPGPIPQTVLAQNLGPGESAVIAYALANPGSGVLLDDQGARSVAAALGYSASRDPRACRPRKDKGTDHRGAACR
jgi:predicted nucleic acid-binding protein